MGGSEAPFGHSSDGLQKCGANCMSRMPESSVSTKLVIGNWKMHGGLRSNEVLLNALVDGMKSMPPGLKVGVCVPFPYLAQANALLAGSRVEWGVQDLSSHHEGAYTGEVSAVMAADFGTRYAIVGHSERREYHREGAILVAEKAERALEAGLTPIVCVGETAEEREYAFTERVLSAQLSAVLDRLSVEQAASMVLAYEPVWAIGSGTSAGVDDVRDVHAFLRGQLAAKGEAVGRIPVLYGGSLKPENAAALFAVPNVDGGLVGGASLSADKFLPICEAGAGQWALG
ncbi:Triosephosphate isomerase [Pararobbsia alpina]|uniref:Triosephosphate isomerase n=2 Tax=Pararobbsia alpina TaxID=621374 RepID=A0A6S7CBT1_9BURK|nr:Triosephosphate isomerase [Pararobbsia alpina]